MLADMPDGFYRSSIFHYSHERQVGCRHQSSTMAIHQNAIRDSLWRKLYCNRKKSIRRSDLMDSCEGIFDLQYSPNGEVLAAACQNKSFIIADPISEKVVSLKEHAHTDCCNTVTFLDDRIFATCSDDHSIAIWDLRNMQQEVHRLLGHSSWVKNVEYHKPSDKLVSSGFDSKILAWNLNETDQAGVIRPKEILEVQGLCRMKLSPEGESMYISSSYIPEITAIHNINIMTMLEDVGPIKRGPVLGYEPEVYAGDKKLTNDQRMLHCTERNHVELYRKIGTGDSEPPLPSYSIDVHPRNSAILLHQLGAETIRTVIQNTKSFYHDCNYEYKLKQDPERFFIRGCETHILEFDNNQDIEYIEEASFSSCGRFFAIPFRYGVFIAAFDNKSEYEACMASKLQSLLSKSEDIDEKGFVPEVSNIYILCSSFGHTSQVLCTAFSPKHIQLATGCQGGKIAFHNPYV